jgi:hypothetical protein
MRDLSDGSKNAVPKPALQSFLTVEVITFGDESSPGGGKEKRDLEK